MIYEFVILCDQEITEDKCWTHGLRPDFAIDANLFISLSDLIP